MQELSMNILDVAQNSIRAGASLVKILILAKTSENFLSITIKDNGCGMNKSEEQHAADPFYTTNRTKKTGFGLPFLKMVSEQTGGQFHINSIPQKGTTVYASFTLNHIDLMPLGDIGGTIAALIYMNPEINYVFCYTRNGHTFELDTKKTKKISNNISFNNASTAVFLRAYITEKTAEIDAMNL